MRALARSHHARSRSGGEAHRPHPDRMAPEPWRPAPDDGVVVLDPFCGCGRTIDAAQAQSRQWTRIDIAFIAVDLIEKRLLDRYPAVAPTYEAFGILRDMGVARALFERSPFNFERWAVSRINAQPNEKQVADRGVDSLFRNLSGRAPRVRQRWRGPSATAFPPFAAVTVRSASSCLRSRRCCEGAGTCAR